MLLNLSYQTSQNQAKNQIQLENLVLHKPCAVFWEHQVAGSNPIAPIDFSAIRYFYCVQNVCTIVQYSRKVYHDQGFLHTSFSNQVYLFRCLSSRCWFICLSQNYEKNKYQINDLYVWHSNYLWCCQFVIAWWLCIYNF